MKTFAMIRFHALGPWIAMALCVACADLRLPPMSAVCVLHVVLQLASCRWLSARRVASITAILMAATILPGIIRLFVYTEPHAINVSTFADHSLAPIRIWVIIALGTAMLFHADQQRSRKRRLLLRKQLQRKVRRRSVQVRRINNALRREVARRQATQQRLTRTETHLQSLAQRMQLQVIRKDTEGVITYANEAFCRGVGKTVSEVIGSTDADLYPAVTATKYRDDDQQVMASGVPVDHVESHPTGDGKTGWVQVFKAPDFDEKKKCIGIQMVFWDVTDTYRRTAELRRSEARKRALFDAAREAVMLVDDQGRIVEANPAAELLLGGGPASLAGCLIESVAVPDATLTALTGDASKSVTGKPENAADRPWVKRAALRWQDLPTSERREMTVRRHDGEVFPAEISVHPIPLENSQGIAVIVRDVTLRHRAIRALRDAKLAAEAANRTKSEFMAGVSHEIRTPLGGITGSAELLSRMDLPPRAKQYVNMIRQSSELLSGVIGDILDFASIEAGRLQIDPAPMDIYQCIGEAFRCLATRASGKDIELVLFIAPNVPRKVFADAKRLRQIVINLAGNAIKFTPRGHVLLRLTFRPDPSPSFIIDVIDSGIGIAKDVQTKIFQPFEQGDSGTTRRYGGTGLGLSISDQLVRQMGGRIEVISRPGHGSTFRCHLPLPAIDEQPLTNRPEAAESKSIAVNITHPVQRTAIIDLLVANGYRIDRQAKLHIVDQTADRRVGFSPNQKLDTHRFAPDEQIIWLARVDDPSPASARPEQIVLLKPILPDDLLSAIEQDFSSPIATLPESQAKLPIPLKSTTERPNRSARLLVVDDSEVNRTVIHDFLSLAGYRADVVDSGAAAIVATGTTTYDCVLMDLQMPELDGVETMQRIVRQCEHREIIAPPVIALTAHATDEHQTRCLDAGMKSFLVKPIDPAKLVAAVDAILGISTEQLIDSPVTVSSLESLPSGVDWQAKLLASAGGDQQTMAALAEAFIIEVPQLCKLLQVSIETRNLKEARRAAHTLKSCLKYVAPQSDWQIALDIENAAQASDVEIVKSLAPQAITIAQLWVDKVGGLTSTHPIGSIVADMLPLHRSIKASLPNE